MHLSEYLEKNKLTPTQFAKQLGVHRSSIVRFCDGSRRPDLGTLERIQRVTKGKVKPQDFYSEAAQ